VNNSVNDTTKSPMNHLDEMTCLLYLERQLDRARAQEISAHTQDCAACRTLLRALERESRLLTRAMLEEEEPLPARLAEFQERVRRSLQWIWALAFGLAATGVYALYTGYIEPWQQRLQEAGFGGTSLLGLLVFQGALWKGWQSMITLLEVIALLTLGGLGLAFFGRRIRIRRGSAVALVLAGLCAVLTLPQAASASEFRKGPSVEVREGETIKGDIFLAGDRVRIEGTVDGDVYVFSHDAAVSGHVTGDVIGFVQTLRISGKVDGNIRAGVNTLTVSGGVGKNALIFADYANLDSTGKIGGSMTAFVQSLNVEGKLGRDILIFSKHIGISGAVGGGIRAKGSTMSIAATGEVNGPVRFEGENPPDVSSSAKLASPVEYTKWEPRPMYRDTHYYVWRVIWTAAFVLFGMVLFLLVPKFAQETINAAELYGAPIGLGVLIFFAVPIAAIIACITVVGLPLGILTMSFWILMLCTAEIVVGAVVGNWILGRTTDTWGMIGRMALGFAIVRIAYTPLSHVHVVGALVGLGIWIWGMGAISLAIYRRFQPRIAPGGPSAPGAPYTSTPLPPNTTVGGVQAL
jgi:cytoskeletal protein CcmA (bactofilin family)